MGRIDRRQIVGGAALAALMAQVGSPGTTAAEGSDGDGQAPPTDRIAALNAEFRGLYAGDRDLGTEVFGDPLRLWRDLLGDTSRRRAGGGFFPFMGVD